MIPTALAGSSKTMGNGTFRRGPQPVPDYASHVDCIEQHCRERADPIEERVAQMLREDRPEDSREHFGVGDQEDQARDDDEDEKDIRFSFTLRGQARRGGKATADNGPAAARNSGPLRRKDGPFSSGQSALQSVRGKLYPMAGNASAIVYPSLSSRKIADNCRVVIVTGGPSSCQSME